jgi:hypothetical protein
MVVLIQVSAWTLVMRYLGVSLSASRAFTGYLLSFLPRYIPGGVWGYVSRSQWLQQSCGIDYATSVLGSVLEALALVSTAVAISGVYLCTRVPAPLRWILAAGVVFLCAFWLFMPRVLLSLARLIFPRFIARFSVDGELVALVNQSHRSGAWFAAFALYLTFWCTYGCAVLLAGKGILSAPVEDLFGMIFATSASWFVGFAVVIIPTGIGIRELTLASLLTSYVGLSSWQGGLVAVLTRFETTLSEFVWLVIAIGLATSRKTNG